MRLLRDEHLSQRLAPLLEDLEQVADNLDAGAIVGFTTGTIRSRRLQIQN